MKQADSQQKNNECTVLFTQVGKEKADAAYLKELDDDLKGAKFDNVDIKNV